MRNVCLAGLVAMVLSACAFTPHDVAVNAQAPRTSSTVGQGVSLSLQVIDDRESTVVGQRGAGMQGADITANQVMSVLERELKAGFEAKGFRVGSADAEADIEVEARLRAFKFFIETGFFAGAENTSVVVAIEAEKLADDYDRTYRSSSEESTLVVPAGSSIDQKLNVSLSEVLRQIMSDARLMSFLSGRTVAPGEVAAVKPVATQSSTARKPDPTASGSAQQGQTEGVKVETVEAMKPCRPAHSQTLARTSFPGRREASGSVRSANRSIDTSTVRPWDKTPCY